MIDVPHRPILRAHLRPHVEVGVGVVLLGEDRRHLLKGAVYEHVTPLLTGQHSTDEIVDRLVDACSAEEVYYAVSQLVARGFVREAGGGVGQGTEAFWDGAGIGPVLAERRLAAWSVRVEQLGEPLLVDAASVLRQHGLCVEQEAAIDVVLTSDYLHPLVRDHHRDAVPERPWLLCKPTGRSVWIGPLFVHGTTSCWQCLATRLEQHWPLETMLRDSRREVTASAPVQRLPSTEHTALSMVATQLTRAIASDDIMSLAGKILCYDAIAHESSHHVVARRPQCPDCGSAALYGEQVNRPVRLETRPVRAGIEGSHRSAEPEETLARFSRHVSPVTGVVSELTPLRVEGAPLIRVYSGGPNIALRLRHLSQLNATVASTNTGKGLTDLEAQVSTLGEAIERYSGVFHRDEPRVSAPLATLDGAISPNACMHFSDHQYAERDVLNPDLPPADRIPRPLDPKLPIEWTPVWSLTEQRHKYLPTSLLYYDYPDSPDDRVCVPVSNGVAAGNSLEEAVLHAILELIERDCIAVWWYNRVPRPAVAWHDALGAYGEALTREYRALGREWWALDLSHDLGVACYTAITRRVDGPHEDILAGFGAHLDATVALRRAVSEMNQVLAVRENTRVVSRLGAQFETWVRDATVEEHPYLKPADEGPTSGAQIATRATSGDLKEDVEWCRAQLERRGMEVLVLDQTRPDIDVPVVRVVVPPLRHFRARFAPGRLYEVPVAMGWCNTMKGETELNPVAFPF